MIEVSPKGAQVVLMFPNDTKVTIEGDITVISQLIKRLDGVEITYTEKLDPDEIMKYL